MAIIHIIYRSMMANKNHSYTSIKESNSLCLSRYSVWLNVLLMAFDRQTGKHAYFLYWPKYLIGIGSHYLSFMHCEQPFSSHISLQHRRYKANMYKSFVHVMHIHYAPFIPFVPSRVYRNGKHTTRHPQKNEKRTEGAAGK